MFSRELILKCFPHKEAVLYNLHVAIELSLEHNTLQDDDRIDILCECHNFLVEKDLIQAVNRANKAGYFLMAAAILEHWKNET